RAYFAPLGIDEELSVEIERGKILIVRLMAVGELSDDGRREVYFELNGQPRSLSVVDAAASKEVVSRERADAGDPESIAAPMPGAVVEVRVSGGDEVKAGEAMVVLSAMKMETVVAAPHAGVVRRVAVKVGEVVDAGDLLLVLSVAE
ncbi:MAG TPA: biotin/lipoyl-binding protein, partial [Nannocystis exedens]|nr:biotin/lipoyl-binding protein [Nannocystis exedens]